MTAVVCARAMAPATLLQNFYNLVCAAAPNQRRLAVHREDCASQGLGVVDHEQPPPHLTDAAMIDQLGQQLLDHRRILDQAQL